MTNHHSNSNPSTHPTPYAPFKMRVDPFKISPRLLDGSLYPLT